MCRHQTSKNLHFSGEYMIEILCIDDPNYSAEQDCKGKNNTLKVRFSKIDTVA